MKREYVYNIKVKVIGGEWKDSGEIVIASGIPEARRKVKTTSLGQTYPRDDQLIFEYDDDKTRARLLQIQQQKQLQKQQYDKKVQSMWWNQD